MELLKAKFQVALYHKRITGTRHFQKSLISLSLVDVLVCWRKGRQMDDIFKMKLHHHTHLIIFIKYFIVV